ncbi:MAG: hypothetical protein QOK91_08320, partial [Nitrososphaeraceae archaeon]|nr:hypothetical protein [Nitrososphaeraceae archaeon]
EQKIIEFIISLKQLQKSYFVIHNHVAPVLTFYAINDIVLNVKKMFVVARAQLVKLAEKGPTFKPQLTR